MITYGQERAAEAIEDAAGILAIKIEHHCADPDERRIALKALHDLLPGAMAGVVIRVKPATVKP